MTDEIKITLKLIDNVYSTIYVGNCQWVMVTDRSSNNFMYQRHVYAIENIETSDEIGDNHNNMIDLWHICCSVFRTSIGKIGISYNEKNDNYTFFLVDKNNGFVLEQIINKNDILISDNFVFDKVKDEKKNLNFIE